MSDTQTKPELDQENGMASVLALDVDKICFILAKARQFAEKVAVTDPDSGSNATDDGMIDILEDDANDPVEHELVSFIHDLNVDEKVELVALAWLGRGDGVVGDWMTLCALARDAANTHTAAYMMGMPLLSDYLEEGLSLFGKSCINRASAALG